MASVDLQFDSHALQAAVTNGAPLTLYTSADSRVLTFVRAFDDTTEEFAEGKFKVPSGLDTDGDVTFTVACKAATPAENMVQHNFAHNAKADGESMNTVYTDELSGNIVMSASADILTLHSWTAAVADLGWAADDLVLFRYSRHANADGVTKLTGDLYVLQLCVKLPLV